MKGKTSSLTGLLLLILLCQATLMCVGCATVGSKTCVVLFYGQRWINRDDFEIEPDLEPPISIAGDLVSEPSEFGIGAWWFPLPTIEFVSIDAAFIYGLDSDTFSAGGADDIELELQYSEMQFGVRLSPSPIANRISPFIKAGFAVHKQDISVEAFDKSVSDGSTSTGFYTGAGIYLLGYGIMLEAGVDYSKIEGEAYNSEFDVGAEPSFRLGIGIHF